MKSVFVLLAAITISFTADASPFVCRDLGGGPDHGFSVIVSADSSRAQISEITIAGATQVADLKCSRTGQKPQFPDQMVPILICHEPHLADAGYTLEVTSGGFIGGIQARLEAITFSGSLPLAQLICFKNAN